MKRLATLGCVCLMAVHVYAQSAYDQASPYRDRHFIYYMELFHRYTVNEVLNYEPDKTGATQDVALRAFQLDGWIAWSLHFLKNVNHSLRDIGPIPLLYFGSLFRGFVASMRFSDPLMEQLEDFAVGKGAPLARYLKHHQKLQQREVLRAMWVSPDKEAADPVSVDGLHNFLQRESDLAFFFGFIGQLTNMAAQRDKLPLSQSAVKKRLSYVQLNIRGSQKRMKRLIFLYAKQNPSTYAAQFAAWTAPAGDFATSGGRFSFAGESLDLFIKDLGAIIR